MAASDGLVLGKLRFDTSALDQQMANITKQQNDLKKLSTEAKTAASSVTKKAGSTTSTNNIEKEQARLLREQKTYTTDLTKAQREYISAVKSGNTELQQYWQTSINKAKENIAAIKETADKTDTTTKVYERIKKTIDDTSMAEQKHADAVAKTTDKTKEQNAEAKKATQNMQNMVSQMERWLATMVLMRGLSNMWREATAYAQDYYDKMNEIRVITGKSAEEANQLGNSYRDLAREMSVTSTEVAEAAVKYWRQGLDQEEVEERLRATTMYAKISAMDFDEAAELMTAATNSMGVAADHVADVWSYLGDASATSAAEIGITMQKVAAVANEAGISFDQLGTYIATLSSKTRQAPQVIGTALNSIISRLQQVKQKGFKDEDGLGINDIAKALSSLKEPIAIMENDEWRAFPDILNDIAAQWQDLTDKEKAYIATTMGGVRQRNYLLTLLEDLSKATEGESQAMRLYKEVLEATGTAEEKYAIWTESVTAAQERLSGEMERFYSILSGETLKGWYNMLSGIMGMINGATEATGGLNLAITGQVGVVTLAILIWTKFKLSLGGTAITAAAVKNALLGISVTSGVATSSVTALGIALRAAFAATIVGAVVSLVAWLVQIGVEAANTEKKIKSLNESLNEKFTQQNSLGGYTERFKELQSSFSGTNEDIEQFNALRGEIVSEYPEIEKSIGHEVTAVGELAGAYQNVTAAIEDMSRAKAIEAQEEALRNRGEYKSSIKSAASQYFKSNTPEGSYAQDLGHKLGRIPHFVYKGLSWPESSFSYDWQQIQGADRSSWSVETYQQLRDSLQEALYKSTAEDIYNVEYRGALDEAIRRVDVWLEQAKDQYGTHIREGILGIVQGALNPDKLQSSELRYMSEITDTITEQIFGELESGTIAPGDVEARAEELAKTYVNWIVSARDLAATYAASYLNSSDATRKWVESAFLNDVSMRNLPAAMAEKIINEFYDAVGIDRTVSPEGELTEAPEVTFDEYFKSAMELLDKIEDIQSIIDKIKSNGVTGDILNSISELFGVDGLQAMMDEATNAAGEIDVSAFIAALTARLYEAQSEADQNPLLAAFGLGSEADINKALQEISEAADIDALKKIWSGLSEEVKAAILENYGDIEEMIGDTEDAVDDSADHIQDNLEKIKKEMAFDADVKAGKYLEDMANILDDIASGGSKAADAFKDVTDSVTNAATAMGALEAAGNGDEEALEYLANMTGLTSEILAENLAPAEYAVAEAANQATNSMVYLVNMLYTAGAITIDASGKVVPLNNIQAAAEAAGMTVAQLATTLAQINGTSLTYQVTPNGMQIKTNIKPVAWKGKATSSGRSSGGGGGGGGGSMKVSDAVTNLLEGFSAKKAIEDYRRELAQLAQSYYKETGELQGVILYLGIERDIVQQNITVVQEYVDQIEDQIKAKQAIIASEKEGSGAYKQAMLDLEKLQEDHQKYSKELIQNKTDVEALTKAIKEQQDAIRQMEIDLRNTILKAIEDRENAEQNMLDGRIAMENEILDIIKKRYETERDELLETANLKKSALQEEKNQIDELLNERKKLAEQEDKMQQVAELEAKIARISADPTRQKEAVSLRSQLAKLREELAWDAAEAEAEAQKKSIDQQIDSIEEYIEYVNNYYEDLFKNPVKLIAEMKEVIAGTDDEIIAWLKQNTEDYAAATEATQTKMVNEWQETLDKMRDTIRTYWDEVETIIEGGADNIIAFLRTYTDEYRRAGQLQAEAYTDEWRKQLDDLEKAHREVVGGISAYDYTAIDTSGSSGGGSGSGGSSGGGSVTTKTAKTHKYGYKDATGKWVEYTGSSDLIAFTAAKAGALAYWLARSGPGVSAVIKEIKNATSSSTGGYIKKFARGGLSTSTGLAWLDGTASQPERILNAYETGLFEDMIDTLHMIRRINTGGILGAPNLSAASALPNIDTINITVEQLNNETDYAEAAERLMNAFYRKIARTRPVGGIQGW